METPGCGVTRPVSGADAFTCPICSRGDLPCGCGIPPLEGGILTLHAPTPFGGGPVAVGFTPYREHLCDEDAGWSLEGSHPLGRASVIGTTSFLTGFDMLGGRIRRERVHQ
jgi:hypothetical protein